MSSGLQLVLSTVLVLTPAACSWAQPGANPYRGDPVRALADFAMPDATRLELRESMRNHRYTDVVTITRDDIAGTATYADLRDMHSGHGQLCRGPVDRSAWPATHEERGLVYCVGETCVIVPTICNNVALVTRQPPVALDEGPIDIEPAAGPPVASEIPDTVSPAFDPLAWLAPIDIGAGAPEDGNEWPGGPGMGLPGGPTRAPPGGEDTPCCAVGPGGPVSPGTPTPTAPVPEPPGWLMLAGAALLFRRNRP